MNIAQFIQRKLFVLRQVSRRKTAVYLLSTMRSGSTLLKSLLAAAPDISHLPEHDFQRYTAQNSWRIKTLSDAPIILMKKPAAYDALDYPVLPPFKPAHTIVLFRDAYETVASLHKMNQKAYPDLVEYWTAERLLLEYWLPINRKLWQLVDQEPKRLCWLRYEDILSHPIDTTARLFSHIGSSQKEGLDQYKPPSNYQWAWGNDDGGEKIKTNRVQPQVLQRNNQQLLQLIEQNEDVIKLRTKLGYLTS